MKKDRILWADDEMDLLSPYILFLEEKGYDVVTATNGKDAVDLCQRETFDIIFLDPPFRRDLLDTVCQRLEQGGWLSDEALIYIEREREGVAPQLPANWRLLKDKQAGQVCYQLYQRESVAP